MVDIVYAPTELLGPLKIYGTSKPDTFAGYLEGWFYPLYVTRTEAIQADQDRGGKGIYRVINFYSVPGEFYMPDSFTNIGKNKDPLIYTKYTGPGAENPFKRIQNKLSILIEDQLPDFIQSDYDMFVKFLKAYYEFLEQNNQAQEVLQDITKYSDIDKTTEDLINKFFTNYATDLTKSNITSNRELVKKIREIYSKKGTEPSYRMLFNVLYKESIDFFYPYDVVLKPSDGKWTTIYALRVRKYIDRQNIFDFENTEILGKTSGAKAIVNKVIKLNLSGYEIYELILDTTSISGNFLPNEDIIAVKTISLIDTTTTTINAKLYSIISKVDVRDGGLGYRPGTQLTITDETGIIAKAEIENVNRFGSIKNINVIEPGVNYSANTIIDAGYPSVPINGTYRIRKGAVTVTFPYQHGLTRGKTIRAYYSGNVFSAIDNTSHTATVLSVPTVRSIRYRYPGF